MRLAILLVALVAMPLDAAPKHKPARGKVGKGFWKVLVTPKATWVLHDTVVDKSATVTIETYDVRKIGDADVARVRWTHRWSGGQSDIGGGGKFTQVAVTSAGLYLLDKDMDDAAVAKALAGKPSRSDPPKAYAGTKLNHGRYLTVDEGTVCMGTGPEPGAGDCPDTCDGSVCMTAAGIVSLDGTYAPNESIFE